MDGAVDLARDRELVEACQAGDQTAFAELYSRYHRRLLRFCLRRLHTNDDAEEAVQEAFTRAWRALPRFGGERRFYPWLTVIAGNVCTDMLRRRSRLVPLDELASRGADGAVDADVDDHLLRQVDLAMASEALGHLSDRHQRVLRLREATEWSSQAIAEHEGVAVPAVDTLLWRARQAFKREFAALTETGGLAAAVGIGVGALRRAIGRAGTRMAAMLAFPTRSPGALVATVAITGAAVAGGGVALIGTTSHPAATSASSSALSAATASTGHGVTAGGTSRAAGRPGAHTTATAPPTSSTATTGRASVTPGSPVAGATSTGVSAFAGRATAGGLGSQAPLSPLGSASSVAVNSVGQVLGSSLATVGGVLGLHPPATPTPGAGSTGSATATTPVTLGATAGAVKTTASGAAGAVKTTLGSATKGLLGTGG
jgi:RNA polymerase sigma factor (sigma-70 family)